MYFPSPFDPRLRVARDRRARTLNGLLAKRGLGDDSSFDWTQSTAAPIQQNTGDIAAAGALTPPIIADPSSPGFTINVPAPILAFPTAGSSGTPFATNSASIARAASMPAPSIPQTIFAGSGALLATPGPAPVSLTSWLSQSMIPGVSNMLLLGGFGLVVLIGSAVGGKKRR